MPKPAIVIAEGDETLHRSLVRFLQDQKLTVLESFATADALQALHTPIADVVAVPVTGSGTGDGVLVAAEIRRRNPAVPLILIVAESSEERAISAIRAGITDYLAPPLALDAVAASVRRCLAHPCGGDRPDSQDAQAAELLQGPRLIGESPAARMLRSCIGKVAATDSTVLITGESGTGKELVAELIHRNGPRRHKPWVCINCAALPDGLLESELFGYERGAFTGAHTSYTGKLKLADGGTVFFDEIGDMSLLAQAKVLRTIEGKEIYRLGGRGAIPVNVRVIAATNQELERLVEEGKFRKDLYFRLNVARIQLPPLRERKEDVPLLVEYYLRELNGRFGRKTEGVAEDALEFLFTHDWPGNVRELKYLLEAVFINLNHSSRTIAFADLPEPFRHRLAHARGASSNERDRMLIALFSTHWNKSKAAEKLHWSRMTLYRKMHKHHIPFLATQLSHGAVTVSHPGVTPSEPHTPGGSLNTPV